MNTHQTTLNLKEYADGCSLPAISCSPLRVLNLFAGLGGNRKDWENVEVTAVELEPDIAEIY